MKKRTMARMSGHVLEESLKDKNGIKQKLQINLASNAHARGDFLGGHGLMNLQEFGDRVMIGFKLGLIIIHSSFLLGGTNHKSIPIMKPTN